MFKIEYSKSSLRYLRKIPRKDSDRIMDKIGDLKQDPYKPNNNIKKLLGTDGYRLRIGGYRVLYSVDNNLLTILIIDINIRGEIYK